MPRTTHGFRPTPAAGTLRLTRLTDHMLVVIERAARQSEPVKVHDEAARITTRFPEADSRTVAQDLQLLAQRRNIRCEA